MRLDRRLSLPGFSRPTLSPVRCTMFVHEFSHRIGALAYLPRILTKAGMRAAIGPLAIMALGAASPAAMDKEQVKVVFDHPLPNVAGKKMVAVTVNYPPGAASLPHHHAAS